MIKVSAIAQEGIEFLYYWLGSDKNTAGLKVKLDIPDNYSNFEYKQLQNGSVYQVIFRP
jgi:hypothetical protein